MRYAKRMLLIPEDVYRSLMTMQQQQQSPSAPTLPNATALGHTIGRMSNATAEASAMSDDERLLHYQQEYKRYAKLLQEERDRPVNVHVDGLTGATDSVLKAIEDVKNAKTPVPETTSKPKRMKTPKMEPSSGKSIFHNRIILFPEKTTEKSSYTSSENHTEGENSSDASENADEFKTPTSSKSDATETPQWHVLNTNEAAKQVLAYIRKYPDKLGVDSQLRIYQQQADGEYRPVRGGNVSKVLAYHFGERSAGGRKPPGYDAFMAQARQDRFVVDRLTGLIASPSTSSKKYKTGAGMKMIKTTSRPSKNIRFKPLLW